MFHVTVWNMTVPKVTPPRFFSSSVQDPAPFWCCGRPLQPIQHAKRWAGKTHPEVWRFGGFCGWPQGWQMDSASPACAEAACHCWSEVSTASTNEGSCQRDYPGTSTDQSKEKEATETLVFKLVMLFYQVYKKAIFFRIRLFVLICFDLLGDVKSLK